MSVASNPKDSPAPSSTAVGGPPMCSRSSRSRPRTTETEPGGAVVVVEAGVVALHPADEPDRQVLVGQQLLERAAVGFVAHQRLPQVVVRGDARGHAGQLGLGQEAAAEVLGDHARDGNT